MQPHQDKAMKRKDALAHSFIKATDTIRELIFIYLGIILLSALAFMYFEAVHFGDAVWMAFVTATSTGYGDFFPKTFPGRVVAVFLMHSVILIIAPLMVYRIIDAVDNNDFTDAEQEEIKRNQREIKELLEQIKAMQTPTDNA